MVSLGVEAVGINYFTAFGFAFIATAAFGILFQAPRKSLPVSGFIGAVGWVVYCYIRKDLAYDSFYAMLFATVALSLLSELAARIFKQPVTIFVIPGIIPIVPGLGMYRGMAAIIENNYETGMNILITTGMDASAIALGMMLMTSVFRVIKISKDHKRLLQLLHKENKQ